MRVERYLHAGEIQVGDQIYVDGAWQAVVAKGPHPDPETDDPDLFVEGDPTSYTGTYRVRPLRGIEPTNAERRERVQKSLQDWQAFLAAYRAMRPQSPLTLRGRLVQRVCPRREER